MPPLFVILVNYGVADLLYLIFVLSMPFSDTFVVI